MAAKTILRAPNMSRGWRNWLIIALIIVAQVLPVLAVMLNAVATDWSGTFLPTGYTSSWIAKVAADPRLAEAVLNSLIVSFMSLAIATLVTVPAVIAAHCYLPSLDRWLAGLVIIPYAVPGIVLALGLLRIYAGDYGLVLTGSPWILIVGYIPLGASFYYLPIKNSLRGMAVKDIFEAGYLLGAGDFAIIRRVILPSVLPAIMIGVVMNFALTISEFVYANLLVGGLFPTLQIFMNVLRGGSGHVLSAVVAAYFIVIFFITSVMFATFSNRSDARQD